MEFPRVRGTLPATGAPDSCPICGPARQMAPDRLVGEWRLVRCPDCELVSLSGASAAGDAVSETNDAFFSSSEFNEWFLAHGDDLRSRYRDDLDRIAELSPVGRLLDVGCGPGLFLDEARARGWSVEGVEASLEPASIARERFSLPIFQGSLGDAPFAAESFDVVTFFDVLEHLPDPRRVLSQAVQLLRPGGLLVAQSPNLRSLMARLTGDKWRWYFLPQHLHHFTPRTLERLLRSASLTPVRTLTWDAHEEFAANLQERFPSLRGGSRPKDALRRGIRAGLRMGSPWWGRRGLGGLIRIFARKEKHA